MASIIDDPPHSEADRFNRQAVQAPRRQQVKEPIKREVPALHRAMNPVPAPAQMSDEGQGGTREAAAMMNEVSAHHRDERDADEVRGASGQAANQIVDRISGKVHWRGSRMESCVGKV